jgi:hypothetical protein
MLPVAGIAAGNFGLFAAQVALGNDAGA